ALALPPVREEREDDAEAVHPPEKAGACACNADRSDTPRPKRHSRGAGVWFHPPRAFLRTLQIHVWRPAFRVDEGQTGGLSCVPSAPRASSIGTRGFLRTHHATRRARKNEKALCRSRNDKGLFCGGVDGTRTRDPRRDRPVF